MQSMPVDAEGKALYSSMTDCFTKSLKSEGVLVLWRGFTPAFVKLGQLWNIGMCARERLVCH